MADRPLSANVATNIRRLRQTRGWTAEDLADIVTLAGAPWTRQTVTKLENGRRATVSVDDLAALAAALGITDPWTLTQRPICPTCCDLPHPGFRCLDCGAETPREETP